MDTTRLRRWFTGLGVTGTLVAATAMPATAQAAAELSVFLPNATVAQGGAVGLIREPIVYASQPVALPPESTITVDFAGLGGKVSVSEFGDLNHCTSQSATVLVCQDPFGIATDELGSAVAFELLLAADPGAAVGDAGTLTVTLAAPGFAPASHTASVRVGEAVDIAAGPQVEASAGPGEAFSAPLTVTNPGDTTITGLNVVFGDDYELRPAVRYSNCTYAGGRLRTCAFDTPIAPGETVTADLEYTVAEDAYAPGVAAGERILMTRADFEDFTDFLTNNGFDLGTPGTDRALELVQPLRTLAAPPQSDVKSENDSTVLNLTITGENGADLAAAGDTVTGAAGDQVTAEIGVTNNGPATLSTERLGSPVTRVDLIAPPGTTVVGVPAACSAMNGDQVDGEHPDRTGASRYRCDPGLLLIAGDAATFTFRLRIDQVIADAAGTVEVNVACECEGFPRDRDLDPANDRAKLLVNPTGGGSGGQGAGEPGAAGQGGSLPITGAPTTLIAGAGAVLVLGGLVVYLLGRRRRARASA